MRHSLLTPGNRRTTLLKKLALGGFFALATACAVWGAALTWAGLHYVRDGLVTAGATMVIGALVALTAAGGFNTWIAERSRAREERARVAYESLTADLMSVFENTPQSRVRAQVATWASPAVVSALSAWNREYDKHVPPGTSGEYELTPDGARAMRRATTNVVLSIRNETGVSSTDDSQAVDRALFNR